MNVSSVAQSTVAQQTVQEASETKATTRQEAAKGDPQAQMKLAREQATAATASSSAPASSGRPRLDVRA